MFSFSMKNLTRPESNANGVVSRVCKDRFQLHHISSILQSAGNPEVDFLKFLASPEES